MSETSFVMLAGRHKRLFLTVRVIAIIFPGCWLMGAVSPCNWFPCQGLVGRVHVLVGACSSFVDMLLTVMLARCNLATHLQHAGEMCNAALVGFCDGCRPMVAKYMAGAAPKTCVTRMSEVGWWIPGRLLGGSVRPMSPLVACTDSSSVILVYSVRCAQSAAPIGS